MTLNHAKIAVALVLLAFALLELRKGDFGAGASRQNTYADVLSALLAPGVILTAVLLTSVSVFSRVFPGAVGVLDGLPAVWVFGLLLIGDDLTQYLWHRWTHATPALYALHRSHHSPDYLSIRIVYRNNVVYYLLMPGVWISGAIVAMGGGHVYPLYILCKMTVIIAAHSSVPWDEPLWKYRWSRSLMWVVERVISTPATHAAHHGRHVSDGVTHYKGNYGNFLFLWDVLFGTALIRRRWPDAYGIEGLEPWHPIRELFWPFPPRDGAGPASRD